MKIKFFNAIFLTILSLAYAHSYANENEKEYFVVLKNIPVLPSGESYGQNVQDLNALNNRIQSLGGNIKATYQQVFVGSLAKLSSQVLSELQTLPEVSFIEPNGQAFLSLDSDKKIAVRSWGIDRIDQRDLPLDNKYKTPYSGLNAHIYIIDTGLRATHEDFTGRIGKGFSALPNDSSTSDCNGHGTHVSGTAMGTSSGVAIHSTIYPVRVFGCGGSTTWDIIVKGMEWVLKNQKKPAVVNMSLGGGRNKAIDTAVANLHKAGISVVVAAGNSNADACRYSPAGAPEAITVASSRIDDRRSSFSNWGQCVDVFAPGEKINSAWKDSDNQYRTLNGTSMASPHVAGAVALARALQPTANTDYISDSIVKTSTKNKIKDPRNSPNRLLFVNAFGIAPTVSAGDDIIQRLPYEKIVLKGSASDEDGYISKSQWAEISDSGKIIFSNWEQELELKGLGVGIYKFQFSATDNDGLTAADEVTVRITDRNLEPISEAGENKTINMGQNIYLNGSRSKDLDGSIDFFQWSKIGGPDEGTISNPNGNTSDFTGYASGQYTFDLTVTDNEGATSSDQVNIFVNMPPVVNAGEDKEITLPQTSAQLSGTANDPENNTVTILWKQKSGPSKATIRMPNSLKPTVENLIPGIYTFILSATDENNAKGQDQVVVTLIDPNIPPVADAGEDIIVELPNESATLIGSCFDEDGYCKSISWRKNESSQLQAVEQQLRKKTDTLTSRLMITGLTEGSHKFELIVTDNLGRKSSDQVTVTVNPPNT